MGPGELSAPFVPVVEDAPAVAHQDARELAEQEFQGVEVAFRIDREQHDLRQRRDPQPTLGPRFFPARFVEVLHLGLGQVVPRFPVRRFQGGGGLPFQIRNRTQGDGDAEEALDGFFDIPFAHAVAAGQVDDGGGEVRADAVGTGAWVTRPQMQMRECPSCWVISARIFGNSAMVDRRRRVVGAGGGGQGFVAGVATSGNISDEILNAFDGQLLLQVRRVAGSGAAFFAGGCLGRGGGLRFERSFRGRGLELVFEIAEFGFEFQQTRFEHGYHEPTSRAIEHGFEFEWR